MLDPNEVHEQIRHHFATVTREEFVANVKYANPDHARELWGDRSVEEICAERRRPVRRARNPFASLGRSVLRLFS